MAGCPTIVLEGVTREVMECMRRMARSQGLPAPEGPGGTESAHGATVDWEWEEGTGILTLTITQIPGWIDCATAESRIRQVARSCGAR